MASLSERDFFRDINRAPGELGNYQVFADWLELRGDPRGPPLRHLGGEAKLSRHEDCFFTSWKSCGISLRFDEDERAMSIVFLYAEGADGFARYGGPMPSGLSLDHSRAQVEALLGAPRQSGGDGAIPFWANYGEQRLHVTYEHKDPKSMANPIHHIGIRRPD